MYSRSVFALTGVSLCAVCYFQPQQAEPLVIDLKDLFQVIFNVRKKEAEASQKVSGSGAFHFKLEKVAFFPFAVRTFSFWTAFMCSCGRTDRKHCIYLNTASLCSLRESHLPMRRHEWHTALEIRKISTIINGLLLFTGWKWHCGSWGKHLEALGFLQIMSLSLNSTFILSLFCFRMEMMPC